MQLACLGVKALGSPPSCSSQLFVFSIISLSHYECCNHVLFATLHEHFATRAMRRELVDDRTPPQSYPFLTPRRWLSRFRTKRHRA